MFEDILKYENYEIVTCPKCKNNKGIEDRETFLGFIEYYCTNCSHIWEED